MAGGVIFQIDTASIERLTARLIAAGKGIRPALARAINHTGDKARTQVVRALVKQTGAKSYAVRRAMHTKPASIGTLIFLIVSSGGYMSLKEFGARQTDKGVSAAPWDKRRVFPHTFIVASLGGHVFERKGSSRLPIRKLWGPSIPKEMVQGFIKSGVRNNGRNGAAGPRRA